MRAPLRCFLLPQFWKARTKLQDERERLLNAWCHASMTLASRMVFAPDAEDFDGGNLKP